MEELGKDRGKDKLPGSRENNISVPEKQLPCRTEARTVARTVGRTEVRMARTKARMARTEGRKGCYWCEGPSPLREKRAVAYDVGVV